MIVKEIRTIRELEENLLTISQACYIAGPISGVKDYRERFNEGARFLEQYNIPAWNPGTHPAGLPYECYFPICFAMIDASSSLLFLSGWENSIGAKREMEYAKKSKREYIVLYYEDLLRDSKPEIGNVIFGNYQGGIPLTRDIYEKEFERLTDLLNIYEPFDNEVFSFQPYYWGNDESLQYKPNFLYKPKRYYIRWYKYPLRDAYASQFLNVEEFKNMIDYCVKSIKDGKKGERLW